MPFKAVQNLDTKDQQPSGRAPKIARAAARHALKYSKAWKLSFEQGL
jgi:hypothetical protein